MSETPVTTSVRAKARAEMTEQIKQKARERLVEDGAGLSLRAVARDLGVVSSAVYRYFASRDELLTALIIDAYNALGAATEEAEAAVPRSDIRGRWLALGRAIRAWSCEHPHEYALLYGTPIPGYAAPQDTIGPASRPVVLFLNLLSDGLERGDIEVPDDRLPKIVRTELERGYADFGYGQLPAPLVARAQTAWAQLFGALSFELFGRLTNVVFDYEAWFDVQLKAMATYMGL